MGVPEREQHAWEHGHWSRAFWGPVVRVSVPVTHINLSQSAATICQPLVCRLPPHHCWVRCFGTLMLGGQELQVVGERDARDHVPQLLVHSSLYLRPPLFLSPTRHSLGAGAAALLTMMLRCVWLSAWGIELHGSCRCVCGSGHAAARGCPLSLSLTRGSLSGSLLRCDACALQGGGRPVCPGALRGGGLPLLHDAGACAVMWRVRGEWLC